MKHHRIEWMDRGREPQCDPNPNFPDGIDVIGHDPGTKHCWVELPYPARRCGLYIVTCDKCMTSVACTTAGRRDDPKSITLKCKLN